MDISNIIFYVLAVLMALFSVLTVTTKSIVRAATYLLFVLFGTAGFYFLLGYTFLGAVQAMVYAGGIIVLYVFSILLTTGATADKLRRISRSKIGAAAITSIVGLALVGFILFSHGFVGKTIGTLNEQTPSIVSIGEHMLSSDKNGYLLPFEAVSVLLLACIVASLVIARKR